MPVLRRYPGERTTYESGAPIVGERGASPGQET